MKKVFKLSGVIIFSVIIMIIFIACGPPRLKGTVGIDGDPLLGKTLTVNTASLGGSGIISYQWMRNGSSIDGMSNTTYTLQDADKNAVITVIVIRSDNSGSVTSTPVTAYGYSIGDTGPGGGIIIYQDLNGFPITGTDEKANYLEASPKNVAAEIAWASSGFISSNIQGTGTAIGTGRANTALILTRDSSAPAAKACADYRGGGKEDWFLPSINELNELYKHRSFFEKTAGFWWSSSQNSNETAMLKDCEDGFQGATSKNSTYSSNVLAVRAF